MKEIRPRVNPEQSPLIDVGNGRVACVFYQPPSSLAPHMVSDWRYYMCAGATNTPMPEEMVSRYYLARQVGDRAALDLLDSLQRGTALDGHIYLNMMVCPMRLDETTVPITEKMAKAITDLTVYATVTSAETVADCRDASGDGMGAGQMIISLRRVIMYNHI